MIIKIEKAKSNRSTCKGCDNKIEKDELRGVANEWSFIARGMSKRYYCKGCTIKKLIAFRDKIDKWLVMLNQNKLL